MTLLHPEGPLPPAVYWRRRAIVLVALVLVVAGVVTLASAIWGGGTPAATPTEEATAETVAPCDVTDLVLTAQTDMDSYAQGERPKLSMTIENTGKAPCTFEVGSDKQKYVITSGSDLIWDSTVCQKTKEPYTAELAPGDPVNFPAIQWARKRSDNCDAGTPAVAGGASYQLTVFVGDAKSAEPKQFMLF